MNKLVRITIITLILGLSLLAVIFTANWLLLAEQERLSSLLQARHKDSYSVSIPLLGTFIPKPLELPRVPNPDVNALFVLPQTLKDVLALRKMVYQPEALTFVDRLKVFLYHCSLSLLVVPVVVLVVLGILILGLCILYRYKNILTGLWRRLKGLLLRDCAFCGKTVDEFYLMVVYIIVELCPEAPDTSEDSTETVVDSPEDNAPEVEDTPDDAPELSKTLQKMMLLKLSKTLQKMMLEDTAEDDAPEVVEDTPEDDAPEVVKDTQEDDAPEVVEDTPEDDASVVVEDTPEDDTSVQSGRSNRKTPAQSSKKTRSRRKKIRPHRKKSTPAQGSGDRDSPVRESGKNRTPAKDSNTHEAGNDNFRRDRRWLEFLEMPTEEREFVQKETPSIEDEFGIKIKFPKRRNYIILQGGRQAVGQACLKLQRLVDLSQPSGVDLLAEVNNTSYRVRPNRIWPCGNVLRKVNVDPSLHGVLIGRSGQTVQGIRNKYCVDIYVPGKSEEYKTIDIVGQSKDVQAAKKEVLRLIRQSTRRSSRMYGNFLRRSTQSYERTSRRRGPKAVSGDVAEEVKSEVVTDDVAEEVESEVVTDDVAEEVESEVVTDDVAEEVESEVVTDDVAEEVESEVVTDDVAEEVESEVVTDDVAEEVESEVVTDDVAEEVKSEVVTDDVAEEVKSEVVTHDVAEEVKSEVVTHDVAEEVKSEVVASGDDWREDTEGFWRVD
ncbi:uncharacterized protein [Panulirus ornatus]|uniref:uncharacterized protein n=1 Tax=Panulirus ornatus TaxID=150431 RepID=UPI003A850873